MALKTEPRKGAHRKLATGLIASIVVLATSLLIPYEIYLYNETITLQKIGTDESGRYAVYSGNEGAFILHKPDSGRYYYVAVDQMPAIANKPYSDDGRRLRFRGESYGVSSLGDLLGDVVGLVKVHGRKITAVVGDRNSYEKVSFLVPADIRLLPSHTLGVPEAGG